MHGRALEEQVAAQEVLVGRALLPRAEAQLSRPPLHLVAHAELKDLAEQAVNVQLLAVKRPVNAAASFFTCPRARSRQLLQVEPQGPQPLQRLRRVAASKRQARALVASLHPVEGAELRDIAPVEKTVGVVEIALLAGDLSDFEAEGWSVQGARQLLRLHHLQHTEQPVPERKRMQGRIALERRRRRQVRVGRIKKFVWKHEGRGRSVSAAWSVGALNHPPHQVERLHQNVVGLRKELEGGACLLASSTDNAAQKKELRRVHAILQAPTALCVDLRHQHQPSSSLREIPCVQLQLGLRCLGLVGPLEGGELRVEAVCVIRTRVEHLSKAHLPCPPCCHISDFQAARHSVAEDEGEGIRVGGGGGKTLACPRVCSESACTQLYESRDALATLEDENLIQAAKPSSPSASPTLLRAEQMVMVSVSISLLIFFPSSRLAGCAWFDSLASALDASGRRLSDCSRTWWGEDARALALLIARLSRENQSSHTLRFPRKNLALLALL
eukprot:760467-Hanusia_phi.AAC.9